MEIKVFKSMLFSVCLLCGICLDGAAQENQKATFKLTDCLNYAFQNSYEARKAGFDTEESNALLKEAKGALLPQLSGSASLTDNIKLPVTFMPGDFFGAPGEDVGISLGMKNEVSAGIDLEQVLFDASLFTGIKISKNAKELARLKEAMTRDELIYNIGNAFYDIIYSGSLLESNLTTLSIMDSIYRKTELQVSQHITREIDLNRMKVNISNMKVDIQKTSATVNQQMNYLKVLMGMPIAYDFELNAEPELSLPSPNYTNNPETDVNDKIELQILDKEKNGNLLEINQLKNAYLPSLSFVASTGYNFQSDKLDLGKGKFWSNGTYVGAKLSIPIFDGAQKHSKIRQAQFRLKKTEEEIKQTQQNILSDRQNALAQLLIGYNSVNVQKENREVAENTYQQGIMLYDEGLYNITDLLDTEKSFRDAQTAYTYELINYQKSLLDLMKSEGTINTLINK
ncbi:Outer membrane protein TolC [termite gut metagenome]|uniref:Outer membrane protein TolC n=1 Tax=termite gut metagenome TaxID=433724 RepID=A0A5J4S1W5_9ZZZZ